MLKAIIVDDEAIVRIGIKSCINWQENCFEIVAEASNGEEAIKCLEETQVDVILTDIKMPIINGIELIKKVRNRWPDIKIVVLSCFNEYEYVREAMKYGAVDYLFKPTMSPAEILKVVLEVKERILSERTAKSEIDKMKEKAEENSNLTGERFLNDYFSGYINNFDVKDEFDKNGIYFSCDRFVCYMIEIDEHEKIKRRYNYEHVQRFYVTFKNAVYEAVGQAKDTVAFMRNDKRIVILQGNNCNSIKEINEKTIEKAKQIHFTLKTYLDLTVTISISNTGNGYESLKNIYTQAEGLLKRKFFIGNGYTISSDNLSSKDINLKDLLKLHLNNLRRTIDLQSKSEIYKYFEDIFSLIKQNPYFEREEVCNIVLEILIILIGKFRESVLIDEYLGDSIDTFEYAFNIETIDELKEWTYSTIDKLFLIIEANISTKYSPAIAKAMSYISKNFSKDISLSFMGDYLNMSKNYFSKVFKEETGENFVDYIGRIRVEHACEMLKNQDLKTYEICELIGYNNYRYFCRVFKKITGMSPLKYKNVRIAEGVNNCEVQKSEREL